MPSQDSYLGSRGSRLIDNLQPRFWLSLSMTCSQNEGAN